MNTYIQKDVEGFYFETTEELMNIGITYPDFLNGRPIKLSDDQVLYHKEHIQADIEEVLNVCEYKDGNVLWYVMETPMTIERAKELKLNELKEYDASDAINDFIVNETIHAWLTPDERSNYRNSVDSAKLLGIHELQIILGGVLFNISTEMAEQALAMIQLYADNCFIVTKTHEANINNLDTIESVEAYDFTTGYPEKLHFTL